MISTEIVSRKIQMLPPASQKEVVDLIDRLLEERVELSPVEKIEAWNKFVDDHADNRAVVNDSREAIYED